MSKFVDRKIEVLITSCGGAGTTLLINFIAQYKITNHYWDEDGLKHLSLPPVSFNRSLKVIYILGEPIPTLVSIFRRGFASVLSSSLQKRNKWNFKKVPNEQTLSEFAVEGVDRFLFEKNYENWRYNFALYPTLFIKYEKIWDYLPKIIEFLELPPNVAAAFPAKIKRESDVLCLDTKVAELLNEMYKAWIARLEDIPDFEIIENKKMPIIFFTCNFWFACLEFFEMGFLQCSYKVKSFFRKIFPTGYEVIKRWWYSLREK